jgi:Na+/H+ antiporter NhaC
MMLFVAAFALASVGYWFLQDLEDRRADAARIPRASTARRVILWFFLLTLSLVLLYLAGVGAPGLGGGAAGGGALGAMGAGGGAGGATGAAGGDTSGIRGTLAYDPTEMLRRIPEDIQVGARTPF